MAKTCEICGEKKKTCKALVEVRKFKGWETETLDMCDQCIIDEDAKLKYKKKVA